MKVNTNLKIQEEKKGNLVLETNNCVIHVLRF